MIKIFLQINKNNSFPGYQKLVIYSSIQSLNKGLYKVFDYWSVAKQKSDFGTLIT